MFENCTILLEERVSTKTNKPYTCAKVVFADNSFLYVFDFKFIDKLILKSVKDTHKN